MFIRDNLFKISIIFKKILRWNQYSYEEIEEMLDNEKIEDQKSIVGLVLVLSYRG